MSDLLIPKTLNDIARAVEEVYRNERQLWGVRLRTIRRVYTERILLREVPPFSECRDCDRRLSLFCPRHVWLKERVVESFWNPAIPWSTPSECPRCGRPLSYQQEDGTWVDGEKASVDHIRPISLRGLEWDRDNLRWMCLPCNVSRGNRISVPPGRQSKLGTESEA